MDVNEEYESIFGIKQRPSLYAPDDAYYIALRKEIISSPREVISNNHLPFDGVRLMPYEDFIIEEIVASAESQGYRIFFIKKYEQEKLVCCGAGFFNPKNSDFIVLQNSFFKASDYFTLLVNKIKDSSIKLKFLNSFVIDNGTLRQTKQITYESASLAASYLLGKQSSFREWKDRRGHTLDAYYTKYKASDIEIKEYKKFPGGFPLSAQMKESILSIVDSLIANKLHPSDKEQTQAKHIFYLKEYGVCDASGYFEEEYKRFVILKGSTFSDSTSRKFDETPIGISRKRFIEAACEESLFEYIVVKNTRCKSPSAAASYMLGKLATHLKWVDINGKTILDCYPNSFLENSPNKNSNVNTNHLFYIKRDYDDENGCDACGCYSSENKTFVIKAGSYLCANISISYRYSSAGIHRRNFLDKNCTKETKGFRLRKDTLFESPSSAASMVLGRQANGWVEWKDSSNKSLDSVYRK